MFEDFDELAKGIAENTISRRQAVKWAGYGVLGAALSSMGFADRAEALTRRQRRRCLERGGIVCGETRREEYCCRRRTTCAGGSTCAERGCRRGGSCETGGFEFGCQGDTDCFCTETVEGTSLCARAAFVCNLSTVTVCTTSQDCPTGQVCARTCCNLTQAVCNIPCSTIE